MKTKMLIFAAALTAGIATAAPPTPTPADNSERNKADANKVVVTPMDQMNASSDDTETTRKLREALVSETDLSTYAHNVKIITVNGKTVLRGPVRTQAEKDKIERVARSVIGGAARIENQLTIAQ